MYIKIISLFTLINVNVKLHKSMLEVAEKWKINFTISLKTLTQTFYFFFLMVFFLVEKLLSLLVCQKLY